MWTNIRRIDSSDQNVAKYVFEAPNAVAESVLYKYPTYEERTVICCSTQSGCPVGCRFCGAGDNFVRNLSAVEIADQPKELIKATGMSGRDIKRLQIMFMSMGEPLLNWPNLKKAIHYLSALWPNAALLISTSGPRVPIYEDLCLLSAAIPTIGLQFSVHESTNEARNKLIPFEAKLTLGEMAIEGMYWAMATGRKPFFNYCVHDGNNSQDDAERLAELFTPDHWESTISVICERDENVAAANERQRQLALDFQEKMRALGFNTRVFDPAGQDDIGGGCGQLWFVQDWMRRNGHLAKPSIGHSMDKVHAPKE